MATVARVPLGAGNMTPGGGGSAATSAMGTECDRLERPQLTSTDKQARAGAAAYLPQQPVGLVPLTHGRLTRATPSLSIPQYLRKRKLDLDQALEQAGGADEVMLGVTP